VISFLEQKTVDKNEDPVKQKLSKVYREIIEKELNDTHFAMTRHIHLVAPGELSPLYTGSSHLSFSDRTLPIHWNQRQK
jgi:hypothetical protein